MNFHTSDFAMIGTLVVLEGLLSADNALVLALLVRHLGPADNALVLALLVRHLGPEEQKKALNLGFILAFVFRMLGILLAGFLMQLWWLCALGSLYLLYLMVRHFIGKHDNQDEKDADAGQGPDFARTVLLVGITDVAFAIDSILAAVAFARGKIMLVYIGGALGIILLRLAAGAFIRVLKKYPSFDNVAYAIVGWAGVKLAFEALHLWGEAQTPHRAVIGLPSEVFWSVMTLITFIGTVIALRSPASPGDLEDATDRAIERAAEHSDQFPMMEKDKGTDNAETRREDDYEASE
jgi:YkoY family integral membrane protein